MILVMTASIRTAKISQLSLTDTETRLKQYCSALRFYIMSKKFDKIVFCDNSGYYYDFHDEQELSGSRGVQLEILKFESNNNLIEKYGKGYGEGEILRYVIQHSQLMVEEDYFYKVTGRLIVKNITKLIKGDGENALFMRNFYAHKSLDTRFWGMKKSEFISVLMKSYERVNDNKGRYLEMCYKTDLDKAAIPYKPFAAYPIIDGYSGTVGKRYYEIKWYTKVLYDIMCHFNIYNSEKGFLLAFLLYNVAVRKRNIIDTYYEYLIYNTN